MVPLLAAVSNPGDNPWEYQQLKEEDSQICGGCLFRHAGIH